MVHVIPPGSMLSVAHLGLSQDLQADRNAAVFDALAPLSLSKAFPAFPA